MFLDSGVRELLKGKGHATIRKNGCDPKTAVVQIPVPAKMPGAPTPDSKLGPRGAGLSIVLNRLDANIKGLVAECLAFGAIRPASRGAAGEIFFEVADAGKLKKVRSEYPAFPADLRDALYSQASASQQEEFAIYLLQKQPKNEKLAHIHADALSARVADRKGDNEKAEGLYKKVMAALHQQPVSLPPRQERGAAVNVQR